MPSAGRAAVTPSTAPQSRRLPRPGSATSLYLLAGAPIRARPTAVPDDHYWTEQALAASPLGWTVLRNNVYAGHDPSWPSPCHRLGPAGHRDAQWRPQLRHPRGLRPHRGRRTRIRFLGPPHPRRHGPAALPRPSSAAIASDLTGRPVAHVSVGPGELRKGMIASACPPASSMARLFR